MIPSPWVGLILALAAYRITRLIGWDDLPPIAKARWWLLGARTVGTSASTSAGMGLTSETTTWVTTYRRPLLAHFIHCAFCLGFWCSVVVYVAWLEVPTQTLYAAVPLALAAVVGLIAKQLDP